MAFGAKQRFIAPIDATYWEIKKSPVNCQLSQRVPSYGYAVFQARAGEALAFHLVNELPHSYQGKATLMSSAPYWRPAMQNTAIAEVTLQGGTIPLRIQGDTVLSMIDALSTGHLATLNIAQGKTYSATQIAVSSVGFAQYYGEWRSCIASLVSTSFKQIASSTLYYQANQLQVSGAVKQRLDQVIRYLKHADDIARITVDSYTDSNGRRAQNKKVSKRRGMAVKQYLVKHGIKSQMITVNPKGEYGARPLDRYGEGNPKDRRIVLTITRNRS